MNEKKGLTLIELLAVIVIISLLIAISLPVVMNLFDRALINSLELQAKSLVKAATQGYSKAILSGTTPTSTIYTYSNKVKTLESGNVELNYTGANPYNGEIDIRSNGEIGFALYDGEYCAKKSFISETITINSTSSSNCTFTELIDQSVCFEFDSDTGAITGYSEDSGCSKDIVIPSQIGGVAVTTIGNDALSFQDFTSVEIPNSVEQIGEDSFRYNLLTNIVIPSSVTSIGSYAFQDNQLTEVILENGVESIGFGAFYNNQITSLTIPESVTYIGFIAFNNNQLPAEDAFIYYRDYDGSINTTRVISYGGAERSNVVIPNGIITLDNYVFADSQIESVTIPNTVKNIYSRAFRGNLLTNVTLPNNLEYIGVEAFAYNNLNTISIPSTVTNIGYTAFNDNQLPDNQAFIYKRNSNGTLDTTNIVSYGGENRSNVVIPSGVITIGYMAFYNLYIANVTLPSSIDYIESSAFQYNSLTNLTLPLGILQINNYAFANNQLTSLAIPNSTSFIGNQAFKYNRLIQGNATIDNSSGNVTLGSNVFDNNGVDGQITITPVYLR